MAVLSTIREKFGVLITILIAVALLSFIVDFNSLSSVLNTSSSKYTVGVVNGKKISYKDFQEQVEYQTRVAELLYGSVSSEEQQNYIRENAWQHFIAKDLFIKNAKAAGIEVGSDELFALTVGDMISPVIYQDPVFGGDVEGIKNFVQNLDADQSGNSRMYWEYVEDNVINNQYFTKYGNLFMATDMDNALTLQDAIEGNNNSYKVQSVMVPFGFEKDSTIVVTSSDIKKYYNAHKAQFKQVLNRDVEYALISVVPSQDDLNAALRAIEGAYNEFATTKNVKNFLTRNSEKSLSNYYYKAGELRTINPEIDNFVFGKADGVSRIVKTNNEFYAARVVDTKNLPDSVYVRHILIQNNNELADSLFNVIKAKKTPFAQVAAMYSADTNNYGGDLGWLTQNRMYPGMESVLTAEINKPYIIDTQYGRHIVEVTKKTKLIQKKQVAILQKTAIPSKATMNAAYNKANTIASAAAGKNIDSLEVAAKRVGVFVEKKNVTEATSSYSSVDKAKEVTRWIFGAKKGEVSNVITVNQNYLFVVAVKDIHKDEYKSVKEVSPMIENIVYADKYADKVLAEVKTKIEGIETIEEVADVLGQTVVTKDNVTFSALRTRDNEPALLGAVAGAEIGKVSAPVKGYMGVYVVCVNEQIPGAFYTEDDAKMEAAQKTSRMSRMILPVMQDDSKTVDNRERFY